MKYRSDTTDFKAFRIESACMRLWLLACGALWKRRGCTDMCLCYQLGFGHGVALGGTHTFEKGLGDEPLGKHWWMSPLISVWGVSLVVGMGRFGGRILGVSLWT